MNEESKFRIKTKKWLLSGVKKTSGASAEARKIKIGDLITVGGRGCLILKFSKHKNENRKRVLVQWVGESESYWINCNTFLELMSGEQNG